MENPAHHFLHALAMFNKEGLPFTEEGFSDFETIYIQVKGLVAWGDLCREAKTIPAGLLKDAIGQENPVKLLEYLQDFKHKR
ncbi:MAG: hypothetical protein K2Q22_06180 [Cytophagales bacterium]|nr:hypothetical protein [Cytophagales bacterium]